jgi:hypothetical protein
VTKRDAGAIAPAWDSYEARLDELGAPNPFTVEAMVDVVARHVGGRIEIREAALDVEAPCGLWLALRGVNYIFVDARSRTHRDHIILHELAHMILGHGSTLPELSALLPDIDPEVVRAALARTSYSDRHEAEAEIQATVMARRVMRDRARSTALPLIRTEPDAE